MNKVYKISFILWVDGKLARQNCNNISTVLAKSESEAAIKLRESLPKAIEIQFIDLVAEIQVQ